jgi:hypothetical protein
VSLLLLPLNITKVVLIQNKDENVHRYAVRRKKEIDRWIEREKTKYFVNYGILFRI